MSLQYKSELQQLHPELVLFHFSKDSSRLYLKLPVKDILYKRNDAGEMVAQLNLRLMFYSTYETRKFTDSISLRFSPPYTEDTTAYILKQLDFIKGKQAHLMAVRLNDLVRGTYAERFMEVNVEEQGAKDFLFVNTATGLPLFNHVSSSSSLVSVQSGHPVDMFCHHFRKTYPLALPPFSSGTVAFSPGQVDTLFIIKSNNGLIPLNKGVYYFQTDTLKDTGAALLKFDDDYPLVTRTEAMVEALRYLTTAEEYAKLNAAQNKRDAIEDFWLDLSGSKERARFLIKTFYTRMQEANLYFTSYLEGWKSDRGMIYLVYGAPFTVYRSSEAEYWDYGNYKSFGPLNFTFKKRRNPFSENDYSLTRLKTYEPVWYLGVDNWRQGRITTER